MPAPATHEFGLFPTEVAVGIEQFKILQRVIRVSDSHLLSLGIPNNEQRANTQNLNMADEVMKAMELRSSKPGIQVCWMNYPINYEQQSIDFVFIRFPFLREKYRTTALVRLQTENGAGPNLQEAIVQRLGNPHTRIETARQLLGHNQQSSIDLSEMNADHCDHILQSVFDIAKRAYINSSPRKTHDLIRELIVTSGSQKTVVTPSVELVSLDDIVLKSKFFRGGDE